MLGAVDTLPRAVTSCRCRYLFVCLLAFVVTQLLIFGAMFNRKCPYVSWLWRGCSTKKPLCPLISPHLGQFTVSTYHFCLVVQKDRFLKLYVLFFYKRGFSLVKDIHMHKTFVFYLCELFMLFDCFYLCYYNSVA